MKKFLIGTIFILMLSMLGCGNKKAKVYLYNFKPEANDAFKQIASIYQRDTGVMVKVNTSASGQYESSLRTEIVKSDAPTIFYLNGYVGLSNWKDYAYDLSGTNAYQSLTQVGKDLSLKEESKVYGIPISVEGYGLIYNKEILDAYFTLTDRESSLNNIEEVKSFSEFNIIVNDLQKYIEGTKATSNYLINNLKGVFATCLKIGSQWPYQSHLSNIPIFYEFLEKNENTIAYGLAAKEVEFKYFDNYMNMLDLYLNNSVTKKENLNETDYDTAVIQFARGEAAFIQQGNWAYSNILNSNMIKEENLGLMPIFMGNREENKYSIPVGTESYWCINKNASSEEINASIEFINWLFTTEEGIKLVNENLGFLAPFEGFKNVEPKDALSKAVHKYMNNTDLKTIEWTFQSYPSDTFKDLFGAGIVEYAKGIITKDELKNIFVSKWKSEKK